MFHTLTTSFAAALLALLAASPSAAFDLQGHRGARGLAPENTLAAFAAALAVGVSTLELDVGVTRDGIVVVTHDQTLSPEMARDGVGRWLNAAGPAINDLTLAELREFDVGRAAPGSRVAERFPEQRPDDGARIPTLDEVIDLAERVGAGHVRFNIETKIDPKQPDLSPAPRVFAAAVIEVLQRRRVTARATIQSFDWRTLQSVQAAAPEIGTVYLTARQRWLDNVAPGSPWTAGFDIRDHGGDVARMVKAAGGAVWSPFHGDLGPGDVASAQALGLKVVPWTVNDPADMAALIASGVDGLISDYPDRARMVMAAAGLPLPTKAP